jgi:deoxyribose-phosphate aldolase
MQNINTYIDHTILKQDTSNVEIDQLCKQAIQYQFAAVCVPPSYVQRGASFLKNSEIGLATVIGFPWGYQTINTKTTEVNDALANGANEIDLVAHIGAIKEANWDYLKKEIETITQILKSKEIALKVIIESGILSEEQIIACCKLYSQFNIQYLKTSTGFASQGATIKAVELMRAHLPAHIHIKASGGIRTLAQATEYIQLGATRIGTSAGVGMVNENH